MSKFPWPMKKIEDLFEVQLGKMLNEKAKQGDLFPYLANFNVRWGYFELSRLNEMAFSEKEKSKFSLRSGDILMCEGGEIGRCAVWKDMDQPIFYQKALHRLRSLDQGMSSEFFCYYMQHIATKGDLPKLVGETSIAHLTREKLIYLRVPAPSLPEQTAIASILSTWDAAIEKTERLIAAKEKRFSWLLNKLINEESVQGKWNLLKLEEIVEINKGQQLNVSDMVQSGRYYVLNGGIEPSGFTDQWNTKENTITISEGGNSCGFVNFNTEKFWCGGHCYALNNLKDGVDSGYLFNFLKYREKSLMLLRVGSGLPNIQKKDIQNFSVAVPPISQQKQIAAILNSARREIDILKKQANACRLLKRGLTQKLLTGKWRVKISKEGDI